MENQFHYIILSSPWDLYTSVFKDIANNKNVTYISRPSKFKLISKLFYFFLHPKLNSIIKIPFRTKLNKLIFGRIKKTNQPLCFIIYYGWYILDNNIVEYIRKKYPEAKVVVYFTDLIKIQTMRFSHSSIDMEYLKEISDLILTYDTEEAKKYNITHYDVPLSIEAFNSENKEPFYDIYFIGQAKDRLPLIMDVYDKLIKYNLKVNFILSNVPIESRKELPGITYIDGLKIPYAQNIENVKNCKCILEIIQGNSSGQTFRTKEAIGYDRKLLTNNTYIQYSPFYNPEYISIFNEPDDIDPEFLKNLKSTYKVDYHFKQNLSPVKLLEFIDQFFRD